VLVDVAASGVGGVGEGCVGDALTEGAASGRAEVRGVGGACVGDVLTGGAAAGCGTDIWTLSGTLGEEGGRGGGGEAEV